MGYICTIARGMVCTILAQYETRRPEFVVKIHVDISLPSRSRAQYVPDMFMFFLGDIYRNIAACCLQCKSTRRELVHATGRNCPSPLSLRDGTASQGRKDVEASQRK
jgi:hypothetical protein